MSVEHVEGRAVFHRERGVRIFNGGLAAFCVVATFGGLVDSATHHDPVSLVFAAWFGACGLWCFRLVMSRLIVDRSGIEIVDVTRRRSYAWSEIGRFELSNWRRRALMVLRDGRKVPLLGYRVSPAEALRGTGSPTERLVNDLNALRPV